MEWRRLFGRGLRTCEMRALIRFLRSLVRARRVADAELRDEFALHLDSRTDDLVRRGLSREAARRQARLEFGPVTAYEERVRDVAGFTIINDFFRDLKLGIRLLGRQRGVVATVVADRRTVKEFLEPFLVGELQGTA